MLKARPEIESDQRIVYCEPSNENWDLENERTLQSGLVASSAYFLAHGVIDIGHFTLPGMAAAAASLGFDAVRCRIGRPLEVHVDPVVMVKIAILKGDGPIFEYANWFWETLLQGMPWYPSIGGSPGPKVCDTTGCTLIAPFWNNIGFWNEPINTTVKPVTTMAFGTFAKALVAGYGTDASTFENGRALQGESLAGNEPQLRAAGLRLAQKQVAKGCTHISGGLTKAAAVEHFQTCEGMDEAAATRAVELLAAALIRSRTTANEPAAMAA